MKQIIVILCLFLLSFTAEAQNSIEQSVEQLRVAMIDPTFTNLDKLIAKDLSYGHSGGKVEDKKTFIDNLLNGNSDFVEITLTDQKIVIHKKTAIVRHKLSAKTNDKGKSPGEVNLHIMTVWVKQGKIWKLLARQAIKIA
jgi:ketosteroid isomerase-like protein